MFNLFKNTTIFSLFLVFFIPLQKGLFIAADMKKILKVDNPNDFARFVEAPELHPLVSVIHYDEVSPFRHSLNNYGVYGLFIQRQFPKILSYGMRTMQASDASIIAVEPGQLGGLEDNGERISLPDEWVCITQLIAQMRQEMERNDDSPSLRSILLGYLRLILEYCNRVYLRQLSMEDKGSNDLLKRFHNLLQQYFRENRQLAHGLPTVAYCASELAYSPRYFGDVIHKATGGTAIGYIHNYVINQAKSLLMNGNNISETSRLLGFDFPHHFTRLFKKVTGITPSEFLGK